jgi:broad specificity phosphatase PhoE
MKERDSSIYFKTSAPIDYELPGYDLYDSIRLTGLGEQFPHIRPDQDPQIIQAVDDLNLDINNTKLYTANSEQALDTALIVSNHYQLEYNIDQRLNPPKFDLADLMTREDFELYGNKKFDVLRERYVLAFYENKFQEPKEDIFQRYLDIVSDYSKSDSIHVLALSHAFLMKFFEGFYLHGDKVLRDKELLVDAWDPTKNPFGRLGGFVVETKK